MFLMRISAKWNANSFIQDLNSVRRLLFPWRNRNYSDFVKARTTATGDRSTQLIRPFYMPQDFCFRFIYILCLLLWSQQFEVNWRRPNIIQYKKKKRFFDETIDKCKEKGLKNRAAFIFLADDADFIMPSTNSKHQCNSKC